MEQSAGLRSSRSAPSMDPMQQMTGRQALGPHAGVDGGTLTPHSQEIFDYFPQLVDPSSLNIPEGNGAAPLRSVKRAHRNTESNTFSKHTQLKARYTIESSIMEEEEYRDSTHTVQPVTGRTCLA